MIFAMAKIMVQARFAQNTGFQDSTIVVIIHHGVSISLPIYVDCGLDMSCYYISPELFLCLLPVVENHAECA